MPSTSHATRSRRMSAATWLGAKRTERAASECGATTPDSGVMLKSRPSAPERHLKDAGTSPLLYTCSGRVTVAPSQTAPNVSASSSSDTSVPRHAPRTLTSETGAEKAPTGTPPGPAAAAV